MAHDNPDPTLIVTTSRRRKPGAALTDPANGERDVLFGENLRDANGRLPNILRGTTGLPLVVKYLRGMEWGEVKAAIARPKLDRLIKELETISTWILTERKTPDPSSDVEEVPQPKRIRTNSRGDESSGTKTSDDEPGPSKHTVGPGGKRSRITNQADRRRSRKGPSASTSDPTAVDANGMLVDVDVQEIEAPKVAQVATADVNHFGRKRRAQIELLISTVETDEKIKQTSQTDESDVQIVSLN
ncbi:hypothetical protein B0H14DRAFT_3742090 [Mycena olivaceomarginata]|nr:hypothetical protein B0H14DRAFT_3742090 [Mycena olivaceomarginata]